MFDIGFSELVVIGVVALIVIGPERLPTVARTAGLWVGKARQFLATVKADIDREIKAAELKKVMEQQAKSSGVYEIVDEAKNSLQEVKKELQDVSASAAITPPSTDAKPTVAETAAESTDTTHRNNKDE